MLYVRRLKGTIAKTFPSSSSFFNFPQSESACLKLLCELHRICANKKKNNNKL